MKSIFPKQEWTDHALEEFRASKLRGFFPIDEANWFPNDMDRAECYVHLLAAMCKFESGFNPKQMYKEKFKNSNGEYVVSTGLLQLSYESVAGYGFKTTTEKLKDPFHNITIAVKILERWITQDKKIAESRPNLGGARYWSVLREPNVNEVKELLSKSFYEPVHAQEEVPQEVARCHAAMLASGQFKTPRYIAEADYSLNSKKHRLWIYDRKLKKLESHKVAHGSGGKNKTPHDGRCREVSNTIESHMSCLGLFKCMEIYDGPHGDSMRLDGLSKTNNNARNRGIVVHRSDYVFDNTEEISGRSLGCPAIDRKVCDAVIEKLCDGSPFMAHYAGEFKI